MQRVADLSSLTPDRGRMVCVNGDDVLLTLDGGRVRAYSDKCPHAGAPLHEGAICNGKIICPWHKAQFRVFDGALVEPPALTSLASYEVSVQGYDVLVGSRIPAGPVNPHKGAGLIFIAGAGAAAASAAASLREFGYAGRVVMAGPETGAPYDRTALSKFVMAGQMKPEEVPSLSPADFYTRQEIERVEETVISLNAQSRKVNLSGGRSFVFDAALIATGALPVRPDIPGANLPGVYLLRSRADATKIIAGLREARHAVVLGAGFIGLEAACGLREQNVDVTVVAPEEIPFARSFGENIGRSIRNMHELHGVVFRAGHRAVRITGDGGVRQVELENGERLDADFVLMGLGVKPTSDFVHGIVREDGGALRVDAGMHAGGDVYAAGDVALFPLPGERSTARIEHWRVAQEHGRIAARNMAGGSARYEGVPFFWTYHYGKRFEYLGHAEHWDKTIIDGDLEQQDFVALLCSEGHVAALVACSRERVTALLMERMRAGLSEYEALKLIKEEK